ncbi:C40 family peptidase [Micromonospora sonneratiae]|uniref:NlpC/P60 family protein n=1 Tax=Micromonospora sonneratiae TaxID=1184706 RepID=A0ABW3YDT7_9ACTN
MTPEPGQEAVVRANVATLWSAPEDLRPVDAPAVATQPDIPGWVATMDADQRVGKCMLSQLLLGDRVLVEEIRPDGWARVIAVEQPASTLDARGYPGWLPTRQLAVHEPGPTGSDTADQDAAGSGERLVVDTASTGLHVTAGGEVRLTDVVLGTRLTSAGPAEAGWHPVRVPGHREPLWVREEHVTSLPTRPPTADEALAVARRLTGVAYVWGGLSPYGIDCSGLVNLTWRRLGVRLSRDAHEQAGTTTDLPLGTERPGDLYFFARPGKRIHHVGIVTAVPEDGGQRRMLHACYQHRGVVEEVLSEDRMATLVEARRI